jgi:hypothetical protein
MRAIRCFLGLLGFLAINLGPALACDPNEECSQCLVSAFGNCTVRGNDPVCEARKLGCQRAPAVVNTPGSPFGPGGPLAPGGPIGMGAPEVQQCLANISSCPAQILARISYEAVRPIVDGYIGFLNSQVGNNLFALDPTFISAIQPYYSVDLRGVRYATGINTLHGMDITIGNTIYFSGNVVVDLNYPVDAKLAYHELEHVVQYANRGGVEPFMAEYILKAGGSILQGGNSISMHDNIDLEQAAIAKANQVENAVAANGGKPNTQPSGAPPVLPAQVTAPPAGNICRIPTGGCYMQMFGPVGFACWCATPGGPANGVISQN